MALGGYKPHPYDCRRYISCWSPSDFYVLSCQPGLFYDERIKTCNYEYAVKCNSQSAPAKKSPKLRGYNSLKTTVYQRPVAYQTPKPTKKFDVVHAVHEEDLSKFVQVVNVPQYAPVGRWTWIYTATDR